MSKTTENPSSTPNGASKANLEKQGFLYDGDIVIPKKGERKEFIQTFGSHSNTGPTIASSEIVKFNKNFNSLVVAFSLISVMGVLLGVYAIKLHLNLKKNQTSQENT